MGQLLTVIIEAIVTPITFVMEVIGMAITLTVTAVIESITSLFPGSKNS